MSISPAPVDPRARNVQFTDEEFTVVLDDGPTLKAVLIGDMAADGAAVGSAVVGVTEIRDHDDEGNELADLRFELEES